MWSEVSLELKKKIPEQIYEIWFPFVIEESYVSSKAGEILILGVPNIYFSNHIEANHKAQIQEIIKSKFGKDVEIQFQIVSSTLIADESLVEAPKSKPSLMKKPKFNGSPYFKSQVELQAYMEASKLQKAPDWQSVKLQSMPDKYGVENVATFSMFDSRFFTYPNDKIKKAKVEMKIGLANALFASAIYIVVSLYLAIKVMVSLVETVAVFTLFSTFFKSLSKLSATQISFALPLSLAPPEYGLSKSFIFH